MQTDNLIDPKDKDLEENQSTQPEENEDVVYLVNDDGTEFDDSERTYISVDSPEEEEQPEKTEDTGK
jgi:hypothetical protein